jgi:hypothetical protein
MTLVLATPEWPQSLEALPPGAFVVVLGNDPYEAVEGRLAGFQLRDTLTILGPEAVRLAFLFRVPTDRTVTETLLSYGTAVLDIDPTRTRWKSEAQRLAALPGSMPKANRSVGTFETRDRRNERPEDFQNPIGRWPTNLVLVHNGCRESCGPRCYARTLDSQVGYYPEFENEGELRAWLQALVRSPSLV